MDGIISLSRLICVATSIRSLVQWVTDNVAPASSEHLNHQCNTFNWHAVKDIEVAPLADIHCGIVIERKVDGVTG